MASHARLAETAVREAMEASDAALLLAQTIQRATADGKVDEDEVADIKRAAARVQRETNEAVAAAERSNVGELLFGSYLTGRPLNPNVMRRAAEVGLVSSPAVVAAMVATEPNAA